MVQLYGVQVGAVRRVWVGMQHVENGNMQAFLHSIRPDCCKKDCCKNIPETCNVLLDELVTKLHDGIQQGHHKYLGDEREDIQRKDDFKSMVESSWQLTQFLSRESVVVLLPEGNMELLSSRLSNLVSLLERAEHACDSLRGDREPRLPDENKPWMKMKFLHSCSDASLHCHRGDPDNVVGNVAVVLRCFLSWRWTLETMCSMAEAVKVLHGVLLPCPVSVLKCRRMR